MQVLLVFLMLVSVTHAVASNTSNNTTLSFLLMIAGGSPDSSVSVVPAVDQTLEDINRDPSILPGHSLEYVLHDTLVKQETYE